MPWLREAAKLVGILGASYCFACHPEWGRGRGVTTKAPWFEKEGVRFHHVSLILNFSDVTCCDFLVGISFAKSVFHGVFTTACGAAYWDIIYVYMRLYDIVLAVHLHVRMFLVDTFTLAGVAVLCGKCGCFCPT